MDHLLSTVLSGLLVGLALAAPLGAIGVLLVQEGVTRGLRGGVPAAAAVALVDVTYCSIALLAGAVAGPLVTSWGRWPQTVGGAVLIALAVHGLVAARRSRERPPREPVPSAGSARTRVVFLRTCVAHVRAPVAFFRTLTGPSRSRFALFVALTALNPATLLYFVAVVPGLDQVASTATARAVFVVGVGVASFGWQVLLVTLGALLRRTTAPGFGGWTVVVGNGVVACLGLVLVAGAL